MSDGWALVGVDTHLTGSPIKQASATDRETALREATTVQRSPSATIWVGGLGSGRCNGSTGLPGREERGPVRGQIICFLYGLAAN